MWVNKGRKFYNRSMKSCLEEIDIEMYSSHNERKSAVAGRFIRTLKNKSYKYMTSISKNLYINKLDDMKPADVKSNTYIDSSKEINDKDHKFKIGDIVRISK